MLYLKSNIIPDTSFAVNKCAHFTHSTKASHETEVKRICKYIQGKMNRVFVFNTSKIMVMYCYVDADFTGLWGYENIQCAICANSRNKVLVTFYNLPLF